jgi:hypothetical protein
MLLTLQIYDFSFKQQVYTGTFEMTKVNEKIPTTTKIKGVGWRACCAMLCGSAGIKKATPKGCHIISFKSVAERKPFQRKGII